MKMGTPAGKNGVFTPGWRTARFDINKRKWADGWFIGAKCPKDESRSTSADGCGRRSVGAAGGARWRELHRWRVQVHGSLRRAGYVARNRWARQPAGLRRHGKHTVPSYRYTQGPAAGCEAVDPWHVAKRLSVCAQSWPVSLRYRQRTGDLSALPIPSRCGLSHVCPVCASTAAGRRARALRAVLLHQHQESPAPVVLVTFTHRASMGEPLQASLERLRGSYRRMTRGRPGKAWKGLVEGVYYGDEAPRSWPGKSTGVEQPERESGEWWHVHRHAIVRLRSGVDPDRARQTVADMWARASEAQAASVGLAGHGWNPAAGIRADGTQGWWVPVPMANPERVYQACKYPSVSGNLRPVALAEFVAAAHGRRWHHGSGCLHGVTKAAADLVADGWLPDEMQGAKHGPNGIELPPDIGVNVSSLKPGECPTLSQVDPNLGLTWDDTSRQPVALLDLPEWVTWTLTDTAPVTLLESIAEEAGGGVYDSLNEQGQPVKLCTLPRDWTKTAARDLTTKIQDFLRPQNVD